MSLQQHSAKVVTAQSYKLKTLTVRDNILVVVLKGRKELHANEQVVVVNQGQAVMIARGTLWDVVNDPLDQGQYEAVALLVGDDVLESFAKMTVLSTQIDVQRVQVIPKNEALQEALFRTLPPPQGQSVSDILLRHRILEVLLYLAEQGFRFVPTKEVSWIEKVQFVVMQNPSADWNVSNLAQHFHLSESTLRRRLEHSETTLAALVKETRLETALGMLQTTNLSVGDVAQRCGWTSHSRFTASFQERWGVMPSVVRSRMKDIA
jgi:AraC-like DNA-binding protein